MPPIPIHVVDVSSGGGTSAIAIALLTLLGAVIGAAIGGGTQWLLDRRRTAREDDTRQRQVKVAARMMIVDLSRAESNIRFCIDHGEWWRTMGLRPRISDNDRRLVIGELSDAGFYDVDLAEGAIDHWYGIREYELEKSQGYGSPTITTQLSKLNEILTWIENARSRLRELSGDPEAVDRTDDTPRTVELSDVGESEAPASSQPGREKAG